MGVKQLTIADSSLVQIRDLSSNFFLTESDVGRTRASAVQAKLQELNDRCELKVGQKKKKEKEKKVGKKSKCFVFLGEKKRIKMQNFCVLFLANQNAKRLYIFALLEIKMIKKCFLFLFFTIFFF